jgi:hypothetical protein
MVYSLQRIMVLAVLAVCAPLRAIGFIPSAPPMAWQVIAMVFHIMILSFQRVAWYGSARIEIR